LTFFFSVNVSPFQVPDSLSPDSVRETLERYGLPAEKLVLEVNEDILQKDAETTRQWLHDIRALGVRIHIDDFGSGVSSLLHFLNFEIDALKIDNGLISELPTHAKKLNLLKGFILFTEAMGLTVIAEGVETAEQQQLVSDLRCNLSQGFFFSHPLPADRFESTLLH
jgi:EAL domain-containing protein (putative c-di-GMP-specific phosphodiesterase class I)